MKYLAISILIAASASAQTPAPEVQQRLAAVKQAIAENHQRLQAYTWTESTELSLKGEVKRMDQKECHYGPDGKVVKVPITAPPEKKTPHGLKGRIVEKKVEEFKEYMDRFGSLISRYVPPNPADLQQAQKSGKATLDKAAGTLVFNDYVKSGDKVAFAFDPAARKLRTFSVNTYLDGPQDVVTVNARFSSLPDGTSYVDESVLTSASKQLKIKTTNFDYKK
ncbi:MAG: hypothetical protein HY821_02810 [Acidobacteria bacterium]|nr:hypothetical protein [Acidobacteriota bacterium]